MINLSPFIRERSHARCIHLDSRLLSRLRRPVGRFNTELLGVLHVQSLPAGELHGAGGPPLPTLQEWDSGRPNLSMQDPSLRGWPTLGFDLSCPLPKNGCPTLC